MTCKHDSTITRTRSDGVKVIRCAACHRVRSINGVTIQGGTFSGDPKRIAELSESDRNFLVVAFTNDKGQWE